MPRSRTGTVRKLRDGRWQAAITLNDGSRVRLPPFPIGTTKARAKSKAAHYAERAQLENWERDEGSAAGLGKGRSVANRSTGRSAAMDAWVTAWLAEREGRGITSARENGQHWRNHIQPVLGAVHVREWTAEGMRALVATLDAKVRDGALAWKSARNIWGTATRMVDDAHRSKVEALRCRDDNPSRDVRGPDHGEQTEKQFLYPSEFLRFAQCEEVPLLWRRMVAVAVYTYMRAGALRVLDWRDVDLEHATIHIHQAYDRATRGVKSTKGKRGRRIPIEPALLPLLRATHAERSSGRVFEDMPSLRTMARALRRWLLRAGVDRSELHAKARTTKPLTFHDLRSTGITWMAIRGDEPLAIQQRAGHRNFTTTQGYIRIAEMLRNGFGAPFPALPLALGSSESDSLLDAHTTRRSLLNDSRYFQRGGRDSNPEDVNDPQQLANVASGSELQPSSVSARQYASGADVRPVQTARERLIEDLVRARNDAAAEGDRRTAAVAHEMLRQVDDLLRVVRHEP